MIKIDVASGGSTLLRRILFLLNQCCVTKSCAITKWLCVASLDLLSLSIKAIRS